MSMLQNLLENRLPTDYAIASVLANKIGAHMLERLDLVSLQPQCIIDLACGVGVCTQLLKQRYPLAQVIAVEYSEHMLQLARKENFSPQNAVTEKYVAADYTQLPFVDHSVDLITANLALPWCSESLEKIFREWRRILRPEGLLMFTSFGPDTLCEFQEMPVEFPQLIDMHDVGDALTQAGFADPVLDVEYLTLTYKDDAQLFQELQATGMLGGDLQKIKLIRNTAGVFPVTHEIIYGHAWGPALTVDHVADEEGVVRIPLSHLRRPRSDSSND